MVKEVEVAKTIHANVYDIEISNLLHELVLKVDEAQRCNEMLARLSTYGAEEKIPVEIVDFIGNYAPIEIIDKQGLIMDAAGLVKKALEGLLKAIQWIIAKLSEIFKFLFNSQYRACKETLDLQRRVITISTNPDTVSKFESTNCSVVQKKDVDDLVFTTQELTQLIVNCSKLDSKEYVDNLIKTFAANGKIRIDSENKLFDDFPDPVALPNTTFGAAGWTVEGYLTTITNYLGTIRGIESLKSISKTVSDEASDLKKRAEEAALKGAGTEGIMKLQKEAALKIMMTNLMAQTIAISVRRSNSILAFLFSIYKELHKLNSGKSM